MKYQGINRREFLRHPRLDADCFVENVFNFPTLAEAYRTAALEVASKRNALAQKAA